MDIQEQSVFYRELVARGISIFPAPEAMQQHHVYFVAQKVLTTVDQRVEIDSASKAKGFPTEEEAIAFVKAFIAWNYTSTSAETSEPVEETETQVFRFEAHMLVDVGFGPQNVSLGELVTDCQAENWLDQISSEAEGRAVKYLKEQYPHTDISKFTRQVKVRPAFAK